MKYSVYRATIKMLQRRADLHSINDRYLICAKEDGEVCLAIKYDEFSSVITEFPSRISFQEIESNYVKAPSHQAARINNRLILPKKFAPLPSDLEFASSSVKELLSYCAAIGTRFEGYETENEISGLELSPYDLWFVKHPEYVESLSLTKNPVQQNYTLKFTSVPICEYGCCRTEFDLSKINDTTLDAVIVTMTERARVAFQRFEDILWSLYSRGRQGFFDQMTESREKKSPAIKALLNTLSLQQGGQTLESATSTKTCVLCEKPATQFRNDVSKNEYGISGICQQCQDEVFGGE